MRHPHLDDRRELRVRNRDNHLTDRTRKDEAGDERTESPIGRVGTRTRKSAAAGDARTLTTAAQALELAIEAARLVRDLIDSAGVSTAEEVLRGIKEEVADRTAQFDRLADELMEYAPCRYCGHGIARIGDEPWRHSAEAPMSRGCRAASFDRDGTWDDSLDRAWNASPPRNYR